MKLNLSFESKILAFICVLGTIRMMLAGFQIYSEEVPLIQVAIVLMFAIVFVSTLIYLLRGNYSSTLSRTFCLLLLCLISYSWIKRDGLASTTSCSMMCGMIIFSALSKGRFLYFIISLTFILEVALLYVWLYQPFGAIVSMPALENEYINYQLFLIMISILVVYFALEFDAEYMQTRRRKMEVKEIIEELNNENEKIKIQHENQKALNEALERKIAIRVSELISSNRKISKYLKISKQELSPTVHDLKVQVDDISSTNNSEYSEWLRKSTDRLFESFSKMKSDES